MGDIMLLRWAKLYSKPTEAEEALEPAIASLGVPYRFQHPLWALRLFPDFVLLNQRVVIEVDDASHKSTKKREADAERTHRLKRANWRVVRVDNEDALADPYGSVDRMMGSLGLELRTKHK